MGRARGTNFNTANNPTSPSVTYIELDVPSGSGQMLRIELVRARTNNAGTSVASRVGLQRMSAASTGTVAAGDKLDATFGATPANVTTWTRSTTATGTLVGSPLVICDAGDARDWFGGFAPPRPWAAILLFDSAALSNEDKIGLCNLTAKQSGGNWQWHASHDQGEFGPRNRCLGRRPRTRDNLYVRRARVANINRVANNGVVGKRFDEYVVERVCLPYWLNSHRRNSPNFQAAAAAGGTTVTATLATDSASWSALAATILVKATPAAAADTASWAPLAPTTRQVVQATLASDAASWSALAAAALFKATPAVCSDAASWAPLAPAFRQVATPAVVMDAASWSALAASPLITDPATLVADAASWSALAATVKVTIAATAPTLVRTSDGFIRNLGSATSKTSGTTLAITVPAGGVPAGDMVVIAVAHDYTSGGPSAADTRLNTWVRDKSAPNGTDIRVSILRSLIATPMQAGDTITITLSAAVVAKAAVAAQFRGVSTTINTSNTSSWSTAYGSSPVTPSVTPTLLVGAFAVRQASTSQLATGQRKAATTGTTGGTDVSVALEYEFTYGPASVAEKIEAQLSTGANVAAASVVYALSAAAAESQSFAETIAALSPVAWWRLDDASKNDGDQALDSSGNGLHGTYKIGATTTTPIYNDTTGAAFDGATQYVEITDTAALSIPTSGAGLSVIALVRPDTLRFESNQGSRVGTTITGGPYTLPATPISVADASHLTTSGYVSIVATDGSVVRVDYTGKSGNNLTGCTTTNGSGKTLATGAQVNQGDNYVYILGKGETSQQEYALRFYSDDDANTGGARPNRISFYTFNLVGGEGSGADYQPSSLTAGAWRLVIGSADPGDDTILDAGNRILVDGLIRSEPLSSGTLYSNPAFNIVPADGTAPLRLATRDKNSFFQGALAHVAIIPRVLQESDAYHLWLALQNEAAAGSLTRWFAPTASFSSSTIIAATTAADSASWQALDPTIRITDAATIATHAWVALDATPKITATATAPIASWQALDPTIRITDAATITMHAWAALDATPRFAQAATTPITAWQAFDAALLVTDAATIAAHAWVALDAAPRISEAATAPVASWQALDAAILAKTTPTTAVDAASWIGLAAATTITVSAVVAADAASWEALTASSATSGSTLATTAVFAWSALDATISITDTATTALSAWQAFSASFAPATLATTALFAFAARDAAILVSDTATTSGFAWDTRPASTTASSPASAAIVSWQASPAGVAVTQAAGVASVSWQGLPAAFSRVASPGVVVASWSTLDAATLLTAASGLAIDSASWLSVDADSFAGSVATQVGQLDTGQPGGLSAALLVKMDANAPVSVAGRAGRSLD